MLAFIASHGLDYHCPFNYHNAKLSSISIHPIHSSFLGHDHIQLGFRVLHIIICF